MDSLYLYLDESGDGGWLPAHGGNSNEPYFVYAGAILTPRQNFEAKDRLNNIFNEHFGRQNHPEEIHYADIVQRNGDFSTLSSAEKDDLTDDLFQLILDLEPTLMATVIDKDRLKRKYGSHANPPKRLAFRATIDRFHKYLREMEGVGSVTIDSSERSFDRQLRELIYDAQDSGIKLEGVDQGDTTLPRLMDTVTMSPSEMSVGIQIADIVAYQVRHEFRYDNDSYGFEALSDLFRDPSGVSLVEPSVVPQ